MPDSASGQTQKAALPARDCEELAAQGTMTQKRAFGRKLYLIFNDMPTPGMRSLSRSNKPFEPVLPSTSDTCSRLPDQRNLHPDEVVASIVNTRIQDFAEKSASNLFILTPGTSHANATFLPVAWAVGTATKRLPVTNHYGYTQRNQPSRLAADRESGRAWPANNAGLTKWRLAPSA
jgi:hypothetical protein